VVGRSGVPRTSAVRIVSVYPELLGTYGDVGNVRVLERRLSWRGLDAEVLSVSVSDPLPTGGDLYVLGGGEDEAQQRALEGLRRSSLARAVAAGAQVFAVCAGLQLLGRSMAGVDGVVHEGLGLLDLTTSRLRERVIGEVLAATTTDIGLPVLTGFANHGGGTVLGPAAQPLATTTRGRGNDGRTGGPEGAVQGNVLATYLHGPVLARNPTLADWLLERAVGAALTPMPHDVADDLHDARAARG
jgi:CobQ-like glutamine amidotransferase family enzyme